MRTIDGMKQVDISVADPVERIQQYIDSYINDSDYEGFEAGLMRHLRIVSAEATPQAPDSTTDWLCSALFEFDVAPQFCNPMQNMHGGAVGLLADMTTTMAAAPIAAEGWWEFGGVSRTLATTFIRPVKVGSTVWVTCRMMSVGRRLSVIQCFMRDKTSRKLLAIAEHGKVALSEQGDTGIREKEKL